MIRIIVCGGRVFTDRAWLWAGLDRLHETVQISEVIEGGADGADRLGGEWADAHGVKRTTVRADWQRYKKRAGYLRNVAMADLGPDYVFAAPGGVGTRMMVDIARQRGIGRIYLERLGVPRTLAPVQGLLT